MKTIRDISGRMSAAKTNALLLASWIGASASLPVEAQTRYTVTDLGSLPGFADSYEWNGSLNVLGHTTAFANNAANPNAFANDASFLWTGPGQVSALPGLPGASDTIAFGLNDLDQAVGDSGAAVFSDAHGVLWQNGVVHDLGTLPGDAGSDAYVINNLGFTTGDSYSPNGTYRAVIWDPSQKIHRLSGRASWSYSYAECINDLGQIAGQAGPDASGDYPGVYWSTKDAAPTYLQKPAGGGSAGPVAINLWAQIVGSVTPNSTGVSIPALWQQGRLTELAVLANDPFGVALGINNWGQIVGFSASLAGFQDLTTAHPILWENGQSIDLQDQIPTGSGWRLEQASSINDLGQIAGIGWRHGQLRACLLTPVDNDGDGQP